MCGWALGTRQDDVSGRAWKPWGGVRSYGMPMGFGVYLKPSLSLSLLMVLNAKIITVLGCSLTSVSSALFLQ